MTKRIGLTLLAIGFLGTILWALSQTAYAATTFVVTGYGDVSDLSPGDGICDTSILAGDQCSLRAALEEANALGPDVTPYQINFDIQVGTGPFTISVGSALPNILVPVEIDGATQPGASCPTANGPANLLIVVDGTNAGLTPGLRFENSADNSLVRGLVIVNFENTGISIYSDGNRFRCNHIGVGADGLTPLPNLAGGLNIQGDNNTVGGEAAHGRRNVISGNNAIGVLINGQNNLVTNNFIGTTASGLSPLGNSTGVSFLSSASNNVLGGTAALARNVIAGNLESGVHLTGGNNTVQGNLIGIGRNGTTAIPNLDGITVISSGNLIGGIAPGEANSIANNTEVGIEVVGIGAVDNNLRGNVFHDNGELAIDLNGNGVDTNDIGDGDTGANGTQNYPSLPAISASRILSFSLVSTPDTVFDIDFYRVSSCDPSGHGEGEELVYRNSYQTGLNGRLDHTVDTQFWNISSGEFLTALATDPNGNTSEFSSCLLVPDPPVTPTATPSSTATPTPTSTASPTPTSTVSPTATATTTPTATPTSTPTSTPPANPPQRAYIPAVLK